MHSNVLNLALLTHGIENARSRHSGLTRSVLLRSAIGLACSAVRPQATAVPTGLGSDEMRLPSGGNKLAASFSQSGREKRGLLQFNPPSRR